MQVTADDLENMMADIVYNETLRNQFLELREGTSDDWIVNEESMRRQLICDWVHKNTPKIMNQWVPTSAVTRRCLGEAHFDMSSTGVYAPSVTCSGHGVCQPDPWLPYAGVCECYRGYEHRDCSILSEGEVVNAQMFHPTNPQKALMPNYFLLVSFTAGGILFLLLNWTILMRKTPIFHNLTTAYSFIILLGGYLILLSYPFWVLLPDRQSCTLKWSILAWGLSIIIGVNGIKMNYVYEEVRFMPKDRPERLALVPSKSLIRDTFKLSLPIILLTVALYISNPTSTYERIPNMIWLKRDVCTYNWMGKGSLYAMLFYVFLQLFISIAVTYQVFLWNRQAYYGDWLYVKETSFIAISLFSQGGLLVAVIYTHLWVTSYPSWCNQSTDPHILLNQTCNIFHEEEKGVGII